MTRDRPERRATPRLIRSCCFTGLSLWRVASATSVHGPEDECPSSNDLPTRVELSPRRSVRVRVAQLGSGPLSPALAGFQASAARPQRTERGAWVVTVCPSSPCKADGPVPSRPGGDDVVPHQYHPRAVRLRRLQTASRGGRGGHRHRSGRITVVALSSSKHTRCADADAKQWYRNLTSSYGDGADVDGTWCDTTRRARRRSRRAVSFHCMPVSLTPPDSLGRKSKIKSKMRRVVAALAPPFLFRAVTFW